MKNLSIFSSAILAGVALAGCNNPGAGEYTYFYPESQTETTGSDVLLTKYEWNGDLSRLVRETQTLNDVPVYEDYEIVYNTKDLTVTRYRTNYSLGDTPVNQMAVSYYTDASLNVISKYEVFNLGANGSETEPVEFWEEQHDSEGNPTYFVRKIDGRIVEERTNYTYTESSNIRTYTLKAAGKETVMGRVETPRNYTTTGKIELYANWKSATETGTIVERIDNFLFHPDIAQYTGWTVTRYDENGENPVTTKVTSVWASKVITVK